MPAATLESFDYSHLIGTDLTVGYADQNESFAAYLPRTGTVARQIALEDWGSDWLVLQLHEPFEYQLGSLDTGFRAVTITSLPRSLPLDRSCYRHATDFCLRPLGRRSRD